MWLQPHPNGLWWPIELPTGVEHPDILAHVVEQLDTIGQHLKSEHGEQ